MKKILLLFFCFIFINSSIVAQNEVCGSYKGFIEDDKKKYPAFYKSIEQKNIQLQENYRKLNYSFNQNQKNSSSQTKIIPVVVHIIHDLGAENVSDDVVYQAIEVLNKNINGQSDNFVSRTPDVFAAQRGVPNIKFVLASIDPNDNPTNGINRVRSSLTNEPDPANSVKALSYWNSYQYYNIWVVKKFKPQDDGNTLLGYAQFPFSGSMATDGVVLLYSEFNDPTSATLTHETGHWLGLCHPWDCGSGECGDDNIFDTPPSRQANYGVQFSDFPYHVGLQNQGCIADSMNWAGEMFMNYMDYTPDIFTTMFSKGQVEVMNETLEIDDEGIPGFRTFMWSEENLVATGCSMLSEPVSCSRQVDIFENAAQYSICEGEDTWFKSNSKIFGNNIISTEWDLGDGTILPGDYQAQLGYYYLHEYAAPGDYDVKFTIEYEENIFLTSSINSFPGSPTSIDSSNKIKIIQGTAQELNSNPLVSNITEHKIDSLGSYWGMTDTSFYRGQIQERVYTANYTNTCTSTILKEDFINVNSSNSNSVPTNNYSFEDSTELDKDWELVNNVNLNNWSFNISEGAEWEWTNEASKEGVGSIMVDSRDNFSNGKTEIISRSFNLSSFTNPAIKFSWSGAAVNTFPENDLKIYYSTNCGKSWLNLGSLGPVNTSRSGYYENSFIPNSYEWNDTVLTNNSLKSNNVRFKFEYEINSASNRFYLDDIRIGESSSLFDISDNISKLLISPNPSEGELFINISNLKDRKITVTLINILGEEIGVLFNGKVNEKSHIINANYKYLTEGIYFISVKSDNQLLLTDKIIIR